MSCILIPLGLFLWVKFLKPLWSWWFGEEREGDNVSPGGQGRKEKLQEQQGGAELRLGQDGKLQEHHGGVDFRLEEVSGDGDTLR